MRRFRRPVFLLFFWGTVLCLSLGKVVEWETDGWWFDAAGYSGMYVQMMDWRFGAFFIVGGAYALLLTLQAKYAWNVAAHSFAPLALHSHDRPGRLIPLEDKLGLDRYRSSLTWWSILTISALAGLAAAARFDLWLRCFYAAPSGQTDVLWHRDLTFYLFKIPAYEAAIAFVNAALWISLVFSTLIYVYEEALELGGHRARIEPAAARHLSLLFALIVSWQGAGCWLRAADAASVGTVSTALVGNGYFGSIDALYRLPWLHVGEWMAPLAGAGMLWLLWRRDLRHANWLGLMTWLALWFATRAVPAWMATTAPAEGDLYPALNLRATRASWGLDAGSVAASQRLAQFAATPGEADSEAAIHALTMAPLWPAEAVRANLSQLLHIRGSALVPGLPSLEYWRAGTEVRPVYVTVCQGAISNDPSATSGESAVFVTDAARGDGAGGPVVYAGPEGRNLPGPLGPATAPDVQLEAQHLKLTYGMWPAAPGVSLDQVATGLYDQYPGRPDVWSNETDEADAPLPPYFDPVQLRGADAGGGVPLSGFSGWLLGIRFSVSSSATAGATGETADGALRLDWHRRVTDRCRQLFPLLDWTHAGTRLVFERDGTPLWLLDGYVWSHRYPDALAPFADDRANYGRAVALATVDGETGTVKFYARDPTELFTQVYRAAFPGVIQAWAALPPDVRAQAQVPAATFVAQSAIWMRLQTGSGGGWRFALAAADSDPAYASAADTVRSVWWPGPDGSSAVSEGAGPVLLAVFALPPGPSADETEHTSAPLGCGALVASPSGDAGSVRLQPWTPPAPLGLPSDLTTSPAIVILPSGRTEYPPPSLLTILPAGASFALADGVAEPAGEGRPWTGGTPAGKASNHTAGEGPAVQLSGAFALVSRDGTVRADTLAELERAVSSRPVASDFDQLQGRFTAARDALATMRQAQAAGDLAAFGAAETKLQAVLEAPDSSVSGTPSLETGNESRQSRVGWNAAPNPNRDGTYRKIRQP